MMNGLSYTPYLPTGTPKGRRFRVHDIPPPIEKNPYLELSLCGKEGILIDEKCSRIGERVLIIVEKKNNLGVSDPKKSPSTAIFLRMECLGIGNTAGDAKTRSLSGNL
jgi:hypothetical protein